MQCYDRNKCAVDSMTLGRLTQRRNMGAINPAAAIRGAARVAQRRRPGGLGFTTAAVAPVAAASGPFAPLVIGGATVATFLTKITNLFGKDPAKVQFDAGRQQVGEGLQAEYDAVMTEANAGKLTSDSLIRHLENMEAWLQNLTGLYNSLRSKIEAAWIDPRYRDQYDFWRKIVNDWRQKWLPTLPREGVLSSLGLGGNSSIPLLLGGLALVMFARGRRS